MEDNIVKLAELQEQDGGGEKRRKQADILIELAAAATLFHTPAPDCDAFADIMIDGHRETHRVRAQVFRRWLRHQYFKAARSGANADAVQVAVETVAAQAMFEGEEREVYCRIAADGGAIYLDIGDRTGVRSRSRAMAGPSSPSRRCASHARPACGRCRSRSAADRSTSYTRSATSPTIASRCLLPRCSPGCGRTPTTRSR